VTQHLLPGRHPSLKDWLMNTLGALAGALLAACCTCWAGCGAGNGCASAGSCRHSAGALALLTLWPVGLLFPAPVPWGLGQVGPRLRDLALDLIDGVPWAQAWRPRCRPTGDPDAAGPAGRALASMLGLLAPVLLAYAVTRPGLQRVCWPPARWCWGCWR
jgi:hypothetical protein